MGSIDNDEGGRKGCSWQGNDAKDSILEKGHVPLFSAIFSPHTRQSPFHLRALSEWDTILSFSLSSLLHAGGGGRGG